MPPAYRRGQPMMSLGVRMRGRVDRGAGGHQSTESLVLK